MYLRLHGNCGAIKEAVDIDAVVGGEIWVYSVSKASFSFVGIEVSGQPVLILWQQHLGLAFEDEEFVPHYQFPSGFQINGIDHEYFHLPPHIPKEEREAGKSRFYQWHFDGSLYKIPPPRVGCLLAVRTPKGPDVKVQWDDGTGTEMAIAPGATAMVAGSRVLELLTPS